GIAARDQHPSARRPGHPAGGLGLGGPVHPLRRSVRAGFRGHGTPPPGHLEDRPGHRVAADPLARGHRPGRHRPRARTGSGCVRAVFALSDLQRDGALLTVALGVTALATPVAMRVALRVGLVDRPAPHKFHREPTPYLGGLAIALSVLASLAFAMVAEPRVRSELMAVAFGATALAAIGLVDDWATISPFPRLAVQAVAAVALWHAGIRVTPSGVQALDLPATILVVMAVTNAVNL